MGKFDDAKNMMKMAADLKKAQGELKKELIEVAAGEKDEVVMQINGELKVKKITLNADEFGIDQKTADKLEKLLIAAFTDGMDEAQKLAAEKMKPLMGSLNLPGIN